MGSGFGGEGKLRDTGFRMHLRIQNQRPYKASTKSPRGPKPQAPNPKPETLNPAGASPELPRVEGFGSKGLGLLGLLGWGLGGVRWV